MPVIHVILASHGKKNWKTRFASLAIYSYYLINYIMFKITNNAVYNDNCARNNPETFL